jgi:glycosyltransferase involved in cell wall biosynthesis
LSEANAAVRTLGVDLEIAAGCAGADVVHCHTWCPTLARHVAKLLHGVPHVVTTHSLEPLRRWKAELGGGYPLSSRDERTAIEAADAVVAVSTGMRRDVLDPDRFTADLAAAITQLRDTPDQAAAMGIAGRRRAVEHFSWSGIADRTVQLYRSVAGVQAPADVSGAPTSNHP